MFNDNDYVVELKKGIINILSVICERIESSKNHKHSNVDKIIALGPNADSNDDLKEKIELLTQFLDVVSL